jgi:hypothetical protein
MKRGLIVLVIILSLFSSGFTHQQPATVSIKKLEVNIWPEYDRPGVLVIYRLQLSADTNLPVKFSLRIPREAGTPYKVAMKDLDGSIYNLEYTMIPEGVWNRVEFTTLSLDVQIEYYDPRLIISEDQHTYEFSWVGDYPIETLQISVQQPRGSNDLTILPYFGPGALNPVDRLVYYTTVIGKVETGITFNLSVKYSKSGNELSASSLPVVAATRISDSTGFGQQVVKIFKPALENQSLVTAAVLIFSALVLFLLVSFLASRRAIKIPLRLRKPMKKQLEKDVQESEVYCSNCGKKIKPGDRFCRVCGSQIE